MSALRERVGGGDPTTSIDLDVPDGAPALHTELHGSAFLSLREVERRHIERVLQEVRWNLRRAARILCITRWSLARRVRKHGIRRPMIVHVGAGTASAVPPRDTGRHPRMPDASRGMAIGLLVIGLVASRVAVADVSGSYDGSMATKTMGAPAAAAAVLSQTGKALTGTLALPADLPTYGGAYIVQGTATQKRLKVKGTGPGGITVKWQARIAGDGVRGKARFKGATSLVATLTLTRNTSAVDGSACDGVYAQNQAFFVGQVLGQSLTSCPACHAPGLQAGATRLHVNASDPLATARAIAVLVDPANLASSRILQKPTNVLPHGGGLQIMPGSSQDLILQQWVTLVAQAHCR